MGSGSGGKIDPRKLVNIQWLPPANPEVPGSEQEFRQKYQGVYVDEQDARDKSPQRMEVGAGKLGEILPDPAEVCS